MSAGFILKSIWVFLLGVVVAVVGLYCLLYRSDMGTSNPFIIMLMGLFFTGAGSIYGKRKLGEGEPMVSAPPQQRTLGYPPQRYPSEPMPPQPRQAPPTYQDYPPREVPAQRVETRVEPKEIPSEEFLEIAEEKMEPEEGVKKPIPSKMALVKPTAKPKETGIIKIVVCPNCGTENETKDKFCYNCGGKLKPEKGKKHKKIKAVEPVKLPAKKPVEPVAKTLPKAIELPAKKKPAKRIKKKPVGEIV